MATAHMRSGDALVSMPGDGHAAPLRAAIAHAFRRCVIAQDQDGDPIDRDDPSRPALAPANGCDGDHSSQGDAATGTESHIMGSPSTVRRRRPSTALARWVCFPFSERAYGPGDYGARAPALAAAFIDERRWQRVARRRLARGSAFGWRAALAAGAAVVRRLPLDAETDVGVDNPFTLAPGLRLVGCMCASRSASVFCARVAVPTEALRSLSRVSLSSPATTTTTCKERSDNMEHAAEQDIHGTEGVAEIECVVKIINVRLSGDFERGWTGTRRSVGRGGHLVCAPAWSEPVALSRAYPTHFYGAGLFFCAADGDWYVCVAMPRYRSTLWAITTGLSPANASDAHAVAWADTLLAALAQVALHTVPRARRNRLAAHNDLKIDNVAYRRTSRTYVYVRVETATGSTLLAIPTHGRLFYLIDFGWSSVSVNGRAGRPVHVESAACAVAGGTTMRAWNAGTDTAQLGYSLMSAVRGRLGCARSVSFYAHAGRAWWPLADALGALMAVGDAPQEGPPCVLPLVGGRIADQQQPHNLAEVKRPQHGGDTDCANAIDGNHIVNDISGEEEQDDLDRDDSSGDGPHDNESSGSIWDDLFYAGISRACRLGRADAFVAAMINRFDVTRTSAPLPRPGRLINTYRLDSLLKSRAHTP
nr:hypothetical protein [Pandoravirus massiliensis]